MEDAALEDFVAYGLGAGVPLKTGSILAEFCDHEGGTAGAHLSDPIMLARHTGITPPLSGDVDREALAAIIDFLRKHDFVTVESDDTLTLTERGVAWWEEYRQPIPREMLRPLLLAAGLDRVADVIEQQALPSIRLTAHTIENEDTLPIGTSKLGGLPDLPPGYEWPRNGEFSLAFIAQINLAEVAPYDAARVLPSSGMLYFFLDYEHYYDQWPSPREIHRVLYCRDASPVLQRTPMPRPLPEWLLVWDRPKYGPYNPCSFTFNAEITLADYLPWYYSSWHSDIHEQLGPITEPFTEEEKEAYYAVKQRLQGPAYTVSRMLGHPDPIQGLDLSPEDVLLLQIDSEEDAGMMWGDIGRLYWWMTKDELARLDFSNVEFDEQCT